MRTSTFNDYRQRMLRVLVHIQTHLDEALCLEDLAGLAHFSPHHFHRVFRGMVGESLMEHVRRLRLERAALRLKTSELPVTRIAFEAGYETHEAFTRAFRAMFGESPSGFREAHRPIVCGQPPSGVHYDARGRVEHFTPDGMGAGTMNVRIEKVEPMRVAFVRHVGPYAQCTAAWGRICEWAGPRGLLGPGVACIGVCHDDPDVTPPDKIRYDACIPVGPHLQAEGDVGVQEIGGGDYAITTHHGPYEKLSETYARLCGQWLPASGRELRSAPSFEIYRNDPGTTPPQDLVTDVYVALE